MIGPLRPYPGKERALLRRGLEGAAGPGGILTNRPRRNPNKIRAGPETRGDDRPHPNDRTRADLSIWHDPRAAADPDMLANGDLAPTLIGQGHAGQIEQAVLIIGLKQNLVRNQAIRANCHLGIIDNQAGAVDRGAGAYLQHRLAPKTDINGANRVGTDADMGRIRPDAEPQSALDRSRKFKAAPGQR